MNPETRILKKITIKNVELAEKMICAWMGKDSSARKERIFDELGEETSAA